MEKKEKVVSNFSAESDPANCALSLMESILFFFNKKWEFFLEFEKRSINSSEANYKMPFLFLKEQTTNKNNRNLLNRISVAHT